MRQLTVAARAAVAQDADWERALDAVLQETADLKATGPVDLAFLFASAAYGDDLPALVRRARTETGATVLIGCSGSGIIGPAREIEAEPAVSLLSVSLPGASLQSFHLSQGDIERCQQPSDWHELTSVAPDAANAWLIFADPFQMQVQALVEALSEAYPRLPLMGGLASGDPAARGTFVFLDDQVYNDGAVAVALGGDYSVRTVVSQGAEPIGQPWTLTEVDGHTVQSIGHRPALEVLVETLQALPPDARRRAQSNLLVGLAMDEYQDQFGRGDFLIRNLLGADPRRGVIAVGAHVRVGQTIQFQLRDAQAADEELQELLARERENLTDGEAIAAVICSCTGRGQGLFGQPDHDARALAEQLGLSHVAGFFCNGEIGPVGQRSFLHGYTASIALIVSSP